MLTAEGATETAAPMFTVSSRARDAFIEAEVERRYGRQASGAPHEWVAYDGDGSGEGN